MQGRIIQHSTGLKLLVAVSITAATSAGCTVLALRWLDAAELFTGGTPERDDWYAAAARRPLNDGCPRRDHDAKKDLTIHFAYVRPLTHFEGQLEVRNNDEHDATLYRGPYAPTITLKGVCYDQAREGGDELDLRFSLITRHHRYSFEGPGRLPVLQFSEVEVLFGRDEHDVFDRAWMRPAQK